jgi:acyl-CoA synthetase (NDP forming)
MPHSLRSPARLLSPRSLAVFGGASAAEVVRQSLKLGFDGAIWPVHPTKTEVEGLRCYASVADLPAAPDAAFLAIPAQQTIAVTQALAARGAGGVVCYASGFAEVGEQGKALQTQLLQAAGDMPLMGPNCYGFLNYLDGVALWPDQHGGKRLPRGPRQDQRGVAIITQSGNLGLNLTMQRRALPLAYLITVGNMAGLDFAALMHSLLDDPRISAIGLHIEGLENVAGFSEAALRALRQGVPVVALKAGSSAKGAVITLSHTSSLSGADRLYDALFERYGIARVHEPGALIETLKLLHTLGPLTGARIVSASCSGGEASLVADLAHLQQLELPDLPEPVHTELQAVLGEKVHVANPLDYHTYIWGDLAAQTACFTAMLGCRFDAHLLILDFPRYDPHNPAWQATIAAFVAAQQATGQSAIVVSSMPEGLPENVAEQLLAHGIAPMMGLSDCLLAIRLATSMGERARWAAILQPLDRPLAAPVSSAPAVSETWDEVRSKQALATFGLPIPQGVLLDGDALQERADGFDFPVVLKAVGAQLAHKTEMGAVHLNIQTADALRGAGHTMRALSDQFLVESMQQGAVAELIVGITRDAQFGLTLTLGAGGVLVELLQDSACLLLPTDGTAIQGALKKLRIYQLLEGYRGQAAADTDALVRAVQSTVRFALAHAESLQELDVNPLLVLPQGQGVVAVDALVRMARNP